MRRLASAGAIAAGLSLTAMAARADELLGQPTPGGIGLQAAASPLKHSAHFFHDAVLLPIITAISLFVLALLIYVVVRFNRRANPTPARWSHNTPLEVIWTIVPVLILMVIAIFSFRLLFQYHDFPKTDLTVKAVGYQWYWGYEYPDLGIGEQTSTMLPENETTPALYRLAASNPMVVPVNTNVRVQVTGADVIHAFAVPALGFITDAVPGRVNEIWFRAEKEGIYYGQCRELCGVDHAFMPIQINVLSRPAFNAWVAQNGGSLTGPAPAAASAVQPGAAPTSPEVAAVPAGAAPGVGGASAAPGQAAATAGAGAPAAAAPATAQQPAAAAPAPATK
jgi:cytochrome c oxidase subunit 2